MNLSLLIMYNCLGIWFWFIFWLILNFTVFFVNRLISTFHLCFDHGGACAIARASLIDLLVLPSYSEGLLFKMLTQFVFQIFSCETMIRFTKWFLIEISHTTSCVVKFVALFLLDVNTWLSKVFSSSVLLNWLRRASLFWMLRLNVWSTGINFRI